jgi:hypothetical protein
MREIAYDRVKRGVLLASVGAAFLLPATAAQATPPAWAPAGGYWCYSAATGQSGDGQSGDGQGAGGQQSGGHITGHKIG